MTGPSEARLSREIERLGYLYDENQRLRRALTVLEQACNAGRNDGCQWCGVGLAAALRELGGKPLEGPAITGEAGAHDSWDSASSEGLWGGPEHLAPNGDPNGDSYLDPGVYELVWGLHEAGVETRWSCQGGGPPHAFMYRTIAVGLNDEPGGREAVRVAKQLGMPILFLARVEGVGGEGDDHQFWWELLFDRWTNWRRNP